MRPRRLLTVGHSYAVALNRRLAAELARAGGDQWEVTALAPQRFHGDLRHVVLETRPGEPNRLESVPAFASRIPHLFFYGPSLIGALRARWDCVHLWEEPYVLAAMQVAASLPSRTPLVFVTYQNIRKRYPPPFRQFERFVVRRFERLDRRGTDRGACPRHIEQLSRSTVGHDPFSASMSTSSDRMQRRAARCFAACTGRSMAPRSSGTWVGWCPRRCSHDARRSGRRGLGLASPAGRRGSSRRRGARVGESVWRPRPDRAPRGPRRGPDVPERDAGPVRPEPDDGAVAGAARKDDHRGVRVRRAGHRQ